jgi:hypothetical protein
MSLNIASSAIRALGVVATTSVCKMVKMSGQVKSAPFSSRHENPQGKVLRTYVNKRERRGRTDRGSLGAEEISQGINPW